MIDEQLSQLLAEVLLLGSGEKDGGASLHLLLIVLQPGFPAWA